MEQSYYVANQELKAQEIQSCPDMFSNHPGLGAEDETPRSVQVDLDISFLNGSVFIIHIIPKAHVTSKNGTQESTP